MGESGTIEQAIRDLDLDRDLPALKRIWREVGWIDYERGEAAVAQFFDCGRTLVAQLHGSAECAVHTVPGTLRLQTTDLPLCAVTAVTTSRIARGHAFAQHLTARQLAYGAADGAAVAALGMFDQGFYDKVGFATGEYEHGFVIDPGTLNVAVPARVPERLSADDHEALHAALCARQIGHGGVTLSPPILLRAELSFAEDEFGLGYRSDGTLSHFVWMETDDAEHGPYRVRYLSYQNSAQLLELLGLLKSLADQVYSVWLREPRELQLQAILRRPFRHRALTSNSEHETAQKANAWWQFRVLNVAACVAALSCARAVEFQLEVTDPLEDLLPAKHDWRGVGGTYRVSLGPSSQAQPGVTTGLPVLRCSVGALSRLLWGVMPASSIALAEDLQAPAELISQLDEAIRLPRAIPGWDF